MTKITVKKRKKHQPISQEIIVPVQAECTECSALSTAYQQSHEVIEAALKSKDLTEKALTRLRTDYEMIQAERSELYNQIDAMGHDLAGFQMTIRALEEEITMLKHSHSAELDQFKQSFAKIQETQKDLQERKLAAEALKQNEQAQKATIRKQKKKQEQDKFARLSSGSSTVKPEKPKKTTTTRRKKTKT